MQGERAGGLWHPRLPGQVLSSNKSKDSVTYCQR